MPYNNVMADNVMANNVMAEPGPRRCPSTADIDLIPLSLSTYRRADTLRIIGSGAAAAENRAQAALAKRQGN
jgi:hypothetical protein